MAVSLILFAGIPVVLAWTPPKSSSVSYNEPAPINVGTDYQFRSKLLGLMGLDAGIRVSRDNEYSPSSIPPNSRANNLSSLLVGSKGKMGAKEYCDQWGNNCMTIQQLKTALGL